MNNDTLPDSTLDWPRPGAYQKAKLPSSYIRLVVDDDAVRPDKSRCFGVYAHLHTAGDKFSLTSEQVCKHTLTNDIKAAMEFWEKISKSLHVPILIALIGKVKDTGTSKVKHTESERLFYPSEYWTDFCVADMVRYVTRA